MQETVPPYVYDFEAPNNNHQFNLAQGDIVKVTGKLQEKFKEYYPAISYPEGSNIDVEYVMILNQSCDLITTKLRSPKVDFITVCLVLEFSKYMRRELNQRFKTEIIGDKKLIINDIYKSLLENFT